MILEGSECAFRGCKHPVRAHIYHQSGDNVFVCQFHRRVVMINLEVHNVLMVQSGSDITAPIQKPGQNKRRPKKENPDWVKEAVQKADGAATPLDDNTPAKPKYFMPDRPVSRQHGA